MKEITSSEEFGNEVIKSEIPVLVDFWATWCGPCKMLGRILETMEERLAGKVKIVKVDIEQNEGLAQEYCVTVLPTVIIFKNGEIKESFQGLKQEKEYLEALASL